MSNAYEKLVEELDQCIADKAKEDLVVGQTLALLEKVDQRRREHPLDRPRWDLRADDLEKSLHESQRRLAYLEQRVLELTRKIESPTEVLETQDGELYSKRPQIIDTTKPFVDFASRKDKTTTLC